MLKFSFFILVSAIMSFSLSAEERKGTPIRFFLGSDGGFSRLNAGSGGGELDKNGFQVDVRALLNKKWEFLSADVGCGWLYNKLIGSSPSGAIRHENVETSVFLTDASLRFRFTERFEAGPQGQFLFGDNVSFGPHSGDHVWTSFAGVEMAYELPWFWHFRITSSVLTDITLLNRQVYMILGGVQFALTPAVQN